MTFKILMSVVAVSALLAGACGNKTASAAADVEAVSAVAEASAAALAAALQVAAVPHQVGNN